MIGVVILTHGAFGEELFLASEMILGRQDRVDIISLKDGFSVDEIAEKLSQIITMNGKSGTIIFTDMFGGTPSNIAFGFLEEGACEVVSGVNLPMLLKTFSMRGDKNASLESIAVEAGNAAKDSIKVAGAILNKGK